MEISVRPASVVVTSIVTFTDVADANAAIATILGTSRNRLSSFLGVTVEQTVRVNLASDSAVVVVSDDGLTAAQSTNDGGGQSNTALVVGLVVPLVLICIIAVIIIWQLLKSAQDRKAPTGVIAQAVNVHDVSATSSTTATHDGRV